MPDQTEWRSVFTEFLATSLYVFICCGIVTSTGNVTFDELNSPRLVVIALTQGLAYTVLLYLTQIVTRYGVGYMNPAVTLAIGITNASHGRYQWGTEKDGKDIKRVIFFLIAQTAGGLLGAAMVVATIPNAANGVSAVGAPQLNYGSTPTSGFVFEVFGTFFLTWVILTNTCRTRSVIAKNVSAPMAIGFAMCALQIFAYPFTGASFNPVRAFSPMIVAMQLSTNLVIYILAPIIGALFGAIIYILAFTNDPLKFGFDYNAPKTM